MTRANILSLADKLKVYADQPGVPADVIIADMRARTSSCRSPRAGATPAARR